MFHRVKSEVQDAEQRVPQQRQKVDLDYRQDESRASSSREIREEASDAEREEPARLYTTIESPIIHQEEVRTMSRPQEEKEVQGKYAREQQEQSPASARPRSAEMSAAPATPSYQRPAPSSVTRPSSYAPTYAPTAPSSYTSLSTAAESSPFASDRTLTIGRGINMSGEIDACDHLIVEGTVEAALKGAKVLDIAESGTFYGTVEIEEATIAGRFEGDLTVNGRLTIRASGVITGSIAYRELEVEAGAMLDGRMTPLKNTVDPKSAEKYRSGSDATAMAKAKDLLSKKDNREPANTESALFSKAHTSY